MEKEIKGINTGDLVRLIWQIEKLRRREGGCTNIDGSEMGDGTFNIYEEALEEGLVKGLELLKLIKKT